MNLFRENNPTMSVLPTQPFTRLYTFNNYSSSKIGNLNFSTVMTNTSSSTVFSNYKITVNGVDIVSPWNNNIIVPVILYVNSSFTLTGNLPVNLIPNAINNISIIFSGVGGNFNLDFNSCMIDVLN